MRRILFPLLGILIVLAFSGDQHPLASARQPDDPAVKLRAIQEQKAALQKQLQELARQEQALRKEMEEKAKEKNYYIKVEVKGRLRKELVELRRSRLVTIVRPPNQLPEMMQDLWTITAQAITWELDLSNNKKLLEAAKACEGKSVQITGALVGRSPDECGFYHVSSQPGPRGCDLEGC